MAQENISTVPIRRYTPRSDRDPDIVGFAFDLWLSSDFRGSPEDALLTATEMCTGQRRAKLFLVPKCKI